MDKLRNVVEEAIERQERAGRGARRGVRRRAHGDARDALASSPTRTGRPGRHEEAIEIEEDVAEISERTLGADAPATLRARVNLAASYWSDGRHDEAIAHRGGGPRRDRARARQRPPRHAHRALEPLVLLRLRRPHRRRHRGPAAGPRRSRPRARRRRGRHARGALEPRAVAVEGRPPRRGDRRRGGGRLGVRAHPRRGRHRDAHRAPRPRVVLPPGRRTPTRRASCRRCSSPTWSACSASTTPRREAAKKPLESDEA